MTTNPDVTDDSAGATSIHVASTWSDNSTSCSYRCAHHYYVLGRAWYYFVSGLEQTALRPARLSTGARA